MSSLQVKGCHILDSFAIGIWKLFCHTNLRTGAFLPFRPGEKILGEEGNVWIPGDYGRYFSILGFFST
jgi:hypothetical protein